MKIGIDMFGNQERNRGRGIGRYTCQLVKQLLTRYPRHEYVLYYHEGLPGADDPWPARPALRTIRRPASRDSLCSPSDYLTCENPDDLDVLILSCAFDCHHTHLPPPRTAGGPKIACVLYDMIPALSPEKYLADAAVSRSYHWALRLARQYDRLLAISEASRLDGLRVLGLSDERVVNIGTGSDGSFFFPDREGAMPEAAARLLRAHGLSDPFVFSTSGNDHRKNLIGLMQAFAQLPAELRQSHQLVVTCSMSDYYRDHWLSVARDLGIGDRLVLVADAPGSANYLNDTVMRVLYQRCAAFVFPSLYEGFGLPILEALQCGGPVVAGRNSSQPEVVGDAGLLANVGDPADIAAKMTSVLSNVELADSLRAKGPVQARQFTWEAMADRAMAVIEELGDSSYHSRWLRQSRPHSIEHLNQTPPACNAPVETPRHLITGASTGYHVNQRSDPEPGQSLPQPPTTPANGRRRSKPRIAFFSPFSPKCSGVVDYSERLLESLRDYYTIDLFHDAGYLPHAALAGGEEGCHDYRLFDRFQRAHDYAGIVYQMCNSDSCGYIYETLQRFPGVVVMHDYALPEFHVWYANTRGLPADGFLADELMLENSELAAELKDSFSDWCSEPGGICRAMLSRGVTLSRRILDHSASVLVHDEWGAGRLTRALPDMAERVFVVPLGAELAPLPEVSKQELKRRLGFDDDALILGCFGFVNGMKYHEEAIEALAALLNDYPSARLLFVGPDYTQGGAQRHAAKLGVSRQVQFFGHTHKETFRDLMAITDIGLNLRRPPTRGETSAALMTLLGAGVATIISEVDAFTSYPDTIVRKVPPLSPGDRALELAIRELAADAPLRQRLGQAAREYVRVRHDWSNVAGLYAEAIEWTRDNRHRWSGAVGQKTKALAMARAAAPAMPAILPQPTTGTAMKGLMHRLARAAWRRTAPARERFWAKLRAEIQSAIAPSEARQAEALADLNRLNEGLLREVLRLQSQVGELVRRDCAAEQWPLEQTAPSAQLAISGWPNSQPVPQLNDRHAAA